MGTAEFGGRGAVARRRILRWALSRALDTTPVVAGSCIYCILTVFLFLILCSAYFSCLCVLRVAHPRTRERLALRRDSALRPRPRAAGSPGSGVPVRLRGRRRGTGEHSPRAVWARAPHTEPDLSRLPLRQKWPLVLPNKLHVRPDSLLIHQHQHQQQQHQHQHQHQHHHHRYYRTPPLSR